MPTQEWTGPVYEDSKIKFSYTADQAQASGYTLKLATENKFVDSDIWVKVTIPQGSLSAGSTTVSASSNATLLGTAQNSVPAGNYISVTGHGAVSVGTAGWIAANTSEQSTDATVYYPLQAAQFNWGTGANANKFYCTTSGYVAANTSNALLSMDTTQVIQTNITTVSGTTATIATATWGEGYITEGHIDAVVFGSQPATGKTQASYIDISGTTNAPVLVSEDYLYINRGYVDDIRISLAKLVPDSAQKPSGASSYSDGLLSGYALYDEDGLLVSGTINSRTWPTSLSSSATSGYSGTNIATSTSNRYINLTSGYYGANKYYLIRAVTTSGINAANIKYGVTVKVGDSADDDRVTSATGTFTQTPTGKTALAAEALRDGYSGFINGEQVDGTMPNATITPSINLPTTSGKTLTDYITPNGASSSNYDVSIIPQYINTEGYSEAHSTAQSGDTKYYKLKSPTFTSAGGTISLVADTTATDTKHSIYTSSSISYITITDSEPDYSTGKVYIKISSTGQIKTTSSGAGAIKASTTISTTGNKTRYVGLNLYTGDYTTG